MAIWVLRALFIIAGAAVGWAVRPDMADPYWWLMGGIVACTAVVVIEWLVSRSSISVISSILFGTLVGMGFALFASQIMDLVAPVEFKMADLETMYMAEGEEEKFMDMSVEQRREEIETVVKANEDRRTFALMIVFIYLGIAVLYKTRDKFQFIIPYVEFRRQERGTRAVLLDTSVIMDGRVPDILQSRIIDGPVIVPQFILHELHRVADSDDKLRRERGRLGLRALNEVRDKPNLDVTIERIDADHRLPVDEQLVQVAKKLNARIMTNDFNLNRMATLEGVDIINLNELANALKPIALPDEKINIKLLKRGEQQGQAVGYLHDGTMVVVEEAAHVIGQQAQVIVTNTITRDTGRMIFGRLSSSGASTTTRMRRSRS